MEMLHFEEKPRKTESLFSQETPWRDDVHPIGGMVDDFSQENSYPEGDSMVLSPEGFFPLKIGMRVRHPKFGVGKVRSVEGLDENQKAIVVFGTVGSKRLKVCSANLEILE
jgi:DNA helicase-2/ATP-dependent DNA helicase PcrA